MGVCKGPSRQSPRLEAIALFKLFKASDQTAEAIRAGILPEPNDVDLYREEVLRLFDYFVSRGRICKIKVRKKLVAKTRKCETEQFRIMEQLQRIRTFIWRMLECWQRWQQGAPLREPAEIAQTVTPRPVELQPAKSQRVIRRSKPLSAEDIERANRAIRCGASTADVAQRFGVSKMTIQRRCTLARRRRRRMDTMDWRDIRATIQAEKAKAASA